MNHGHAAIIADVPRASSTAATPEVARAIGKVVSIATAKPRAGKAKRKVG